MRAAIYGAGAMGTVLGAFISKAGVQIDLITRNQSHVQALKQNGAHITGTVDFTVKVNALLPDEMTGKYDVVFLMTKQRGNKQTVEFLRDYLAEGGVICTTQNGVPEPSVAEVIGEENCVGCAISWGATFVGNGEASLTSSPDKLTFALGTFYNNAEKLKLVEPYLMLMGKVTIEDNFVGARWSKLIVNSAFSTLSAVTGLTFGQISKNHTARRLAQSILKEGMDVAFANGITPAKIQGHDLVKFLYYRGPVKKLISFALIPIAMKKHKLLVSGMYYDLKNGKQCDVDFVCGVVEKYGEIAFVATPTCSVAIKLIKDIENGKCQISPKNIVVLKNELAH